MMHYRINLLLFAVLNFISACGGSGSESKPSQPTTQLNSTVTTTYTCGNLLANETCISLVMPDHYSQERHFILNKPDTIEEGAPLFIVLHGSGRRADETVSRFAFREFLQRNNFIGAFPNSIVRDDNISTWNAHNNTYGIPHIDDVNFIKEMIIKVVSEDKANAQKVYLFGWSNGGFMANRLACEIPEYISAIFTLAGNLREELNSCSLAGNVAIHHLHATGDETVPYEGDESRGYISAEQAIFRWVEFNRCDLTPFISNPFDLTMDETGQESTSYMYQNCDVPTDFTVITGSDHGPSFHNDVLHQQMFNFYQKSH
jgi:polyhydroxybutyrate depolymerase